MLCQDNARLIVEAFRKILAITDALVKKERIAAGYTDDIQSIMRESSEIKATLIKELNEIGGVLVSREDFFRLISSFGDIMDHIHSVGLRLSGMEKRGWKVPEEVAEQLTEVADHAFDSLLKLREAMMSLGFNSQKSIAFTKEIDEIERKVDTVHVQVEMNIIASDAGLPTIIMLKDIVNQIEELVDTVREASDLIRIIAL
jgi:predicted phosphate transport protein (TIGR00153 family)